jgi:hypothetical protein
MLCFVCYFVPVVMLLLFTFIVNEIIISIRCDRWWEKLLGCGQGEGCFSYPDNEHSLKKTSDSIDDFENNVSSSTSCYWKLYYNFSHHRSQRFITFTLSSDFKAFLFTDVDDFDMMH